MALRASHARLVYAAGLGLGVLGFFLGAALEPGVDAASNDAEAMAIIQADPLGQRASHVLYAVSGLGFATAGWARLKANAGHDRRRLAWTGAIGLGIGGLALSASSLVVATLVVDLALRGDEAGFARVHAAAGQGFAMMIPLSLGLASIAFLELREAARTTAKVLHGLGAVAGLSTAIGLFGALVMDFEPLGMLAGAILILPPWLLFHLVAIVAASVRGLGPGHRGPTDAGPFAPAGPETRR